MNKISFKKYRIIYKKTLDGVMYLTQVKYFLIPIWFKTDKDFLCLK